MRNKLEARPDHSLVLPRTWRSRLYPTSSDPTRYSRGHTVSNALSRCTHLRDIAGQVHIRIRCQQSVRLHLLKLRKWANPVLVLHTFLKFVTRRFVRKLCLSSSGYSSHMRIVARLVTRRKQVPVTEV